MEGDEKPETASRGVQASHIGSWTISEVEGRGSSPGRGLPPAHNMKLEGDDGGTFSIERARGSQEFTVRKLVQASYVEFDRCPICEEPDPKSREHVPPQGLGGGVSTLTCLRCNNEFGSRLENDLQDWFDDATRVRFSSASTHGERRAPRMLIRRNQDGAPVFLLDVGKVDPEIDAMFESGEFTITHTFPSEQRVRLALLKSAYLAACCLMRAIPATPRAIAIRELLMKARDAPRRDPLPQSPILDELRFHRSFGEGSPEIAIVAWPEDDEITIGVSLARTVLVSWPLEPLQLVRVPVPADDVEAGSESR